jgi:endonuclease G
MRSPIAAAALVLACGAAAAAGAPPPKGDGAPSFSSCEARYAVTGLPTMKADESDGGPIALCRQGYAVAFDPATRTPDWVIERLPQDWVDPSGKAKRKNNFRADPDVDQRIDGKGPQTADYKSSGFDQGHQAPAGDFRSSQPMTDESFLLTNMAPQVGIGFNRNIWKDLETDIREWIICGGRPELYIVTGPVFGKAKQSLKGQGRVRVPTAFFKVIYDPRDDRALGMLLPNEKLKSADLPKYAVAISEIEDQTGIVFFPAMSKRKQTVLKSNTGTLWGEDDDCSKGAQE